MRILSKKEMFNIINKIIKMKSIKIYRTAKKRTENLDGLNQISRKIKALHLGDTFKTALDRLTFYPFLRLCETSKILITIGILIIKSVIK